MRKFITDILAKTNLGVEQNAYVLGYVGIGTSSASQKLEVSGGDALIRNAFIGLIPSYGINYASFSHTSRSAVNKYSFLSGNAGDTYVNSSNGFPVYFRHENIDNAIITAEGKLGIGTTSPSYKLDVNGSFRSAGFWSSASAISFWGGGASETAYGVLTWDTGYAKIYATSGNKLHLGANGENNHITIDTSGNVGIGTTSPSYKLQVNADGAGLYVLGANTAPYTQTIASFVYGGNSNSINIENQAGKASIQARAGGSTMDLLLNPVSGNVGIGTGSPTSKLHIDGIDPFIRINNVGSANTQGLKISYSYSDTHGFHLLYNANNAASYLDNTYPITPGQSWGDIYFRQNGGTGSMLTRMTIKADGGNVGIGTTSPAAKLDVVGEARFGSNYKAIVGDDGTYGGYSTIGFGGTTNGYNRVFGHPGTSDGLFLCSSTGNSISFRPNGGVTDVFVVGANGYLYSNSYLFAYEDGSYNRFYRPNGTVGIYLGASDAGNYYDNTTHYFRNSGGGANYAIIDSNGNVGIGTTSPSQKLVVIGNAAISGVVYTDYVQTYSGTSIDFRHQDASVVMRVDTANARVGIGTTSPAAKLDVIGKGVFGTMASSRAAYSNGLSLQNNTGEATSLFLWQSGVASAHIGSPANNTSLYIVNSYNTGLITDPNSIVLTNTGNVGIGTTSPSKKLDVVGTTETSIRVMDTGGSSLELYQQATDSYIIATNSTRFYNGGSERVIITSSGNVGIGTTSPGEKLTVAGDIGIYENGANRKLYISNSAGSTTVQVSPNGASYFNGGNVGIGTTSPVSLLNLNNGDIWTNVVSTLRGLQFGYAGPSHGSYRAAVMGGAESYGGTDSGMLTFHTQNGYVVSAVPPERMRITSSGDVGIGTTSPAYKLDVNGIGRFTDNVAINGTLIGTDQTFGGPYRTFAFGTNSNGFNRIFAANDTSDGLYLNSATGRGIYFRVNGGGANVVSIDSTGAATFSSSVTAARLILNNGDNLTWGGGYGAGIPTIAGYNAGSGGSLYFYPNGSTSGSTLTIAPTGAATFSSSVSSAELLVNNSVPKITFTPLTYGGSYRTVLGARGNAESVLQLGNNGNNYIVAGNTNFGGALSFYVNATSDFITSTNGTLALTLASSSAATFSSSVTAATYFVSDGGDFGWGNGTTYIDGDSSNQYIRAVINNSEKLRIVSSGNVGIGTTSPSTLLDVGGEVSIAYNATYGLRFYNDARNNWSFIGNNVSGSSSANLRFGDATGEVMRITGGTIGIGTTSPAAKLDVVGSAGIRVNEDGIGTKVISIRSDFAGVDPAINVSTNNALLLQTNNTERMRIAAGGNVGIGTTSPQDKLTVKGTTDYNLNLGTLGGYSGIYVYNDASSAYKELRIDAAALILQSYSGGNVGIGTTNPAANFVVSNAGASGFEVAPTGGVGSGVLLQAYNRSTSAYMAQSYYALTHTFNVGSGAGTRVLDITSAGNVGIGTSSPTQKLDVSGNIQGTTGLTLTGNAAKVSTTYAGVTTTNFFTDASGGVISVDGSNKISLRQGGVSGTDAITIAGSGNVGIGTTNPSSTLDVSSSANATTMTITSDGANEQFRIRRYSDNNKQLIFGYHSSNFGTIQAVEQGVNYRNLILEPYGGNVGIGTTSPGYKLETIGNARISGNLSIGTTYNGFAANIEGVLYLINGSAWVTDGYGYANASATTTGMFPDSSNNITFKNNNSTTVYINSSGNVGIGTTSPVEKLQVTNGNISIRNTSEGTWGSLRFGTTNTSYLTEWAGIDSDWEGVGINVANLRFYTSYGSIGERMRITSQGNVGIGTTSPTQKLHLYGSGNQLLFIENSSTYHLYAGISSNVGILGSNNATPLSLQTNGVSRVYLDTSGNVGIGTASPFNKLTIGSIPASGYGLITISSDWASGTAISTGIKIGAANDTGGAGVDIRSHSNYAASSGTEMSFWTNSTGNVLSEYMRITNSGNVGIGTTSPVAALHVQSSSTKLFLSNTDFVANTTGSGMILHTGASSGNTYSQIYAFQSGNTAYANLVIPGGNVGIGTTAPLFNLQVGANSGTLATTTIRLQNSYLDTNGYYGFNIDAVDNGVDGHDLRFLGRTSPTGTFSELVRIKNSGNVGIGTSSPSQKLQVIGQAAIGSGAQAIVGTDGTYAGYATTGFGGTTNGYNRVFGHVGTSDGLYLAAATGRGIDFWTNGSATSRMFIEPGGNVGIGTTSPGSKLEVVGTGPVAGFISSNTNLYTTYRANGSDVGYIGNGVGTISGGSAGDFGFQSIANTVFSTGGSGVERMRITSGGNVGIGTTSPSSKLHVWNGGIKTTAFPSAGNPFTFLESNYNDTAVTVKFLNINPTNGLDADLGIQLMNVGGSMVDVFTIKGSSGNVGIGTTSPNAKFTILAASTGYSSDSQIKISDSTTSYYGGLSFDDAGATRLSIRNSYDGTGSIIGFGFGSSADKVQIIDGTGLIVNEGNVGIGTTNPVTGLDVRTSPYSNTTARFGTSRPVYIINDDPIIGFNQYYNSGWKSGTTGYSGNIGVSSSGEMYFNVSTASVATDNTVTQREVIRILNNGNVGIGTASPYSKLEITPSSVAWGEGIVINPASGYSAIFYRLEGAQGSNYTGTWAVGKAFSGDGGGELLQVVKNGLTGSAAYRVDASQQWKTNGDSIFGFNVGIGTTSPSYKLHVEGNVSGISIYASHDIAAFSDITVKKDVKKIENAIEKVKELNGYTYVRTDDETGTRRAGVIAQEVQKVLPEVVSQNPDGTLNVAYANMVALLIEAVKEQQKEIDELKRMLNK